jgi:hypothetical protein
LDLDNFKSVDDSSGRETGYRAHITVPKQCHGEFGAVLLTAACTTRMTTWQMYPYPQLATMIAEKDAVRGS